MKTIKTRWGEAKVHGNPTPHKITTLGPNEMNVLNTPHYSDPYIVHGPGRSGTSFICEILHNHFNVQMAHADQFNESISELSPIGNYECHTLSTILAFLREKNMVYNHFLKSILSYFAGRMENTNKLNKKWGFKDIAGNPLLVILTVFSDPRIIICRRDPELVFKSLTKLKMAQGLPQQQAENIAHGRIETCERIFNLLRGYKNLLTIYFREERLSRKEAIQIIERKFPELKPKEGVDERDR